MGVLNLFFVYLMLIIGVLISVAFMVLFERKILGYIQIRKGPNKVGYMGILQSFGDAVKLFIKEQYFPWSANLMVYYFSPVFSLFIMMLLWPITPWGVYSVNFSYGVIFFFCCMGFGVYTLLGSGWSSNSNYAMLGAVRGVAQTISYEVSMALLFMSLIFLMMSYSSYDLQWSQNMVWFFFMMSPIFLCWVTSSLAETNRTPFDFAEGESELVSGFNIEYGSGGFALLFLAEYGSIIFMSYLVVLMFAGGSVMMNFLFYNFLSCFFCYWFIWVRGTMPRYRYDKLMYLAWKCFLPISLWFIIMYLGGLLVM
uniref:NADH dehydrogenase subunit 1 n=1 Tax=Cyphoderus aff. similis TaxID=2901280 RepID=UPI001EDD4196|nr:NADH dehydrogenase subunit 1 [Cyphoderus aff. similis]UIR97924.1 NADH dehydrogenase subunit 1 [Cyphoderus aff. similis]